MHSINSSPFLWRFIDTTKSKSDICLQHNDSKDTSESVIQSCKSEHDVIAGQPIDSVSWLSKLVKARVESTNCVGRDSNHPLQAKYETPTIKDETTLDCQAKLISQATHYSISSLPPKKRPMSISPDNDVEAISKKFKSGPATIRAFPMVEIDTKKYPGVLKDIQNENRKPENVSFSWRFIDTTKSKSDICLQHNDSKDNSESFIQSCKSEHDVTAGQSIDSVSWLSKLVKATVESTNCVSRESKHSLQAKYETPTIKDETTLDCQAKLMSQATHSSTSSLPLKKRPGSISPDSDVEIISKQFKSGPATIRAFPMKYPGVPKDIQNENRKPENISFSWRFHTTKSKSDICLQHDSKSSSESVIQSCKSEHDVTAGQYIDYVSWLSKLVKARVESTNCVSKESNHPLQAKYETPLDSQAKLISQATHYITRSLPPKKRPMSISPDNDVEAISKKFKSGPATIRAFPMVEIDTKKYPGVPKDIQNENRKPENISFSWRFIDTTKSKSDICLQHDSKSSSESVIQSCKSEHDVTDGQPIDYVSWLSKLVKARVESTNFVSRESNHPLQAKYETPTIKDETTLDSQAKLISQATHYSTSSLPPKKRPRSISPDNDVETISKKFKYGPATIRAFPMINKEPNQSDIHILDPWPCRYRTTEFGELKKVGELDVEMSRSFWRRTGNDLLYHS